MNDNDKGGRGCGECINRQPDNRKKKKTGAEGATGEEDEIDGNVVDEHTTQKDIPTRHLLSKA